MTTIPSEPKQRMLEAALELLRESGDPAAVTVRRIAERAGVGIGLVNYHFGTKEDLVQECVRFAINDAIRQWDARLARRPRTPRARLEAMLEAAAAFLAQHPKVSRISIQYDLQRPRSDDNTSVTITGLIPCLREIFGPKGADQDLQVLAVQLIAPIQFAFLRSGPSLGFDFLDASARERFVRRLVGNVLGALGPEGRP